MSDFVTAITTGITAFTATNIDDIVILTLLFSQINKTFRSRHILGGQYLGFAALIVASLPGFFGGLIIPQDWIRLLGLMPIIIGVSSLLKREEDSPEEAQEETEPSCPSVIASFFSPQTCNVAAIDLNVPTVKVVNSKTANWFIPDISQALINTRVPNAPSNQS